MHRISNLVGDVTKTYLGKKGLLFAKLLQSWPLIVGEQKAKMAFPQKISFAKSKTDKTGKKTGATLILSTTSSYATILQHEKDIWREKVNLFLGIHTIDDIKFIHAAPTASKEPKKMRRVERTPKLTTQQIKEIEDTIKDVTDLNLKETLKNFAQSLYLDSKL